MGSSMKSARRIPGTGFLSVHCELNPAARPFQQVPVIFDSAIKKSGCPNLRVTRFVSLTSIEPCKKRYMGLRFSLCITTSPTFLTASFRKEVTYHAKNQRTHPSFGVSAWNAGKDQPNAV